jgi:cytochrome c biogenesis protein CcmG/thiol:disulfide interchange protein DsbE
MATPKTDSKSGSSWAVFVSAFVVIVGFLVLPRVFTRRSPLEGTAAPAWSLSVVANVNPVDGQAKQLSLSQLQGKVVFLDFWATWCGPCKSQAPILEKFARAHPNDVVVVGINTDDEPGRGGAWARGHGLTYPIVYDEANVAGRAYGVRNLPTLVVVDRNAAVMAVRIGVTDADELESLFKKAQ